MKKQYFLFALICLALPILLRTLWFYQGVYLRSSTHQSPDYGSFSVPQPTLSTQPAFQSVTSVQKKTVLIDFAHTNRFSLAEIDPMTNILLQMGANIQIDKDGKDLPGKLQDANAYVIIAPTVSFNKEAIQSIQDFIARGGHLLIIADPTRTYQNYYFDMEDSVLIVNQIIDSFEIAFKTDYVYSITHNEGNYRNIYASPDGNSQILKSLSNIVFYGAHSLAGNFIPLLKGDETTLSSGTDQSGDLTIAATSMDGNILFVGDMGFMVTPYNQVVDNFQLLINIAEFLAGESRARSIADFPNLFTRPLVILDNGDFSIDKSVLSELSSIQSVYRTRGIQVFVSNQPEDGKDLLILGSYPPSDELKTYLKSSGFQFITSENSFYDNPATIQPDGNNTGNSITSSTKEIQIDFKNDFFIFPGIGSIPAKGFNFIFYSQNEKQNTLILLTESRKSVIDLLKLITKGSLKDCFLQQRMAVCPGGIALKDTPIPIIPTVTPTPVVTITSTSTPAG
jgi:hypothetical protein